MFESLFVPFLTGFIGNTFNRFFDEVMPTREQKFAEQSFKDNLKFQKDKLKYDQNLQQQIFAREDNAVQRRVEDLKAAGINPIFAAGSSAGAGSVVPTVAPHGDMSGVSAANANKLAKMHALMGFMKMRSEIAHTDADTERIKEQTKNEKVYLDIADRRLELDLARLGLDHLHYHRQLSEQALNTERVELERQRLIIQKSQHEIDKVMAELNQRKISQEIASERLKAIGLSINNTNLILENDIKAYDLQKSQEAMIRYKDSMNALEKSGSIISRSIADSVLNRREERERKKALEAEKAKSSRARGGGSKGNSGFFK